MLVLRSCGVLARHGIDESRLSLELEIGLEDLALGCQWPMGAKTEAVLCIWEFPKIRGTYFGVLTIRILLFRVVY